MVLLDVRHVMLEPFHWDGGQWLLFAGYTAAIAAASPADRTLSNRARASDYSLGFFGDTFEGLGDARSLVLLAGFYGAGLIGHDSKAKAVCLDGLASSFIASLLITPVITTAVGRERPTVENGAYSFRPFRGRAFPSGHATQVFAVVSVIATHYDQFWVKAVAYTAGLAGSWPRLRRGKHFPTDLLAGGIIGTAVGRSVVHYNDKLRSGEPEAARRREEGVRLTIFPVVQGDGVGLAGTLSF
jgi:membrane-associated phospholipid phosphatase